MPWQHPTPGKDPVPIVQEAGWASGPVWTGAENLAAPGFDPRTVQQCIFWVELILAFYMVEVCK